MTPHTPVSLVAFDMDGVLYDFHPERRRACLAELTGRDPDWIQATIWESDFEQDAERGAYSTGDAYLQAFNQRLGVPITREQWVVSRRCALTPRASMLDLLDTLCRRVDVAVLSNNGALVRETLPLVVPEVWALLGERVHVSADFGARKPEAQVYQRLADRYARRPAEVLFIDDSMANVEGARAAGLQAVHFETEAGLAGVLRDVLAGLR